MSRLVLRCEDHPEFRAIRRQRVDCDACEHLYRLVNPENLYWRIRKWLAREVLP